MYDCMTIQGATFNMCGQLFCGHANATALFSSPVVSALGSESDDQGSNPGWGKALCPWDVRGKKKRAPLLGLAKSIYYMGARRYGISLRVFNSIAHEWDVDFNMRSEIPHLQATMYYFVYHINTIAIYWQERSFLFTNEDKRIDNPRS